MRDISPLGSYRGRVPGVFLFPLLVAEPDQREHSQQKSEQDALAIHGAHHHAEGPVTAAANAPATVDVQYADQPDQYEAHGTMGWKTAHPERDRVSFRYARGAALHDERVNERSTSSTVQQAHPHQPVGAQAHIVEVDQYQVVVLRLVVRSFGASKIGHI